MNSAHPAATQARSPLREGEPVPPAIPRPATNSRKAGKPKPKPQGKSMRQFWLKQFRTWHWVSAAMSLTAMLLFAVTGITLNHASAIPATPVVVSKDAALPKSLLHALTGDMAESAPLPEAVAAEVDELVGIDVRGEPVEWSPEEAYVAIPGPGRDAWVSIDRASGAIASERTDRGWISFLNDLHKGRHTGSAWFWFIDAFALACIVFTITGLLLLQIHAKNRPSTWPLVAGGTLAPIVIIILFLHT
nr:PepSY-associated TM helix domain-containing protein [Novosphingobium profundi]